jgi:cell division protein FtsB
MSAVNSIWDQLTRVVFGLLLVATIIGVVLWYSPVIKQNERMRKEKLALDEKINHELDAAKKLDASIRSLQDPRTIERLARERLSYAKPGETVIHFETPAASAAR